MNHTYPAALALGAAALFAGPAAAQPAPPSWHPAPSITASLDIGGSGNFTGVIDNQRLCYMIDAAGIMNPTAVRIVSTKPDKAGQVVLQLQPPVGGAGGDCVPIAADLAGRLVRNAHNFALEIDTAAYPNGAVSAPLVGMNG